MSVKKRRLNQADAGERSGLSRREIGEIENGIFRGSVLKVQRYAVSLGFSLALQGSSGIEQENVGAEKLSEILNWNGSDDLFETLLNKYLLQTTISGVQPKVLVPEINDSVEKSTLLLPTFIIKSGDAEFPQLALNEFICMKLAKACHIDTPEFWLSDNQQLFVMRRFDITKNVVQWKIWLCYKESPVMISIYQVTNRLVKYFIFFHRKYKQIMKFF